MQTQTQNKNQAINYYYLYLLNFDRFNSKLFKTNNPLHFCNKITYIKKENHQNRNEYEV